METLAPPLTQSPQFAATCDALGLPVRRGSISSNGETRAAWLVQSRRLPLLGAVDFVSRGPVLAPGADSGGALATMARACRRTMVFNAPAPAGRQMAAMGFWPLMTPASVAILPLGPVPSMRAALRQKWRNRLNRAEAGALALRRLRLEDTPDHWLPAADMAQQRRRGYRNWPATLMRAYAHTNPGTALIFEATLAGDPVAALLVLRHGPVATYAAGVTTAAGRREQAHSWLLWQAMTHLWDLGHSRLDLGTVNGQDAPGLCRFKLGTGARIERLGGTWLRHAALAPVARRLPATLAA